VSAASQRRFGAFARAVMAHPRVVIALVIVISALSVALSTRLTVNTNLLALLPDEDPVTVAIRKLNDEEGGTNIISLAVKGDDPAALDAWMKGVAADLEAVEGVDYVLYDIDPTLAAQLAALQLSQAELGLLHERLTGAVALGPAAANPFVAAKLLDLGPLTQRLAAPPSSTAVLGGIDGVARLVVRPVGSAFDAKFAAPLMARVDEVVDRHDAEKAGLEVVWLGGAYRHAVEDVQAVRTDLFWTGIVSFSMVLALVAFAFRDLRAVIIVFVPLLLANLWTTGFALIAVRSLNTFTSFYPAILIGLGIDFGIHLYARYQEERAEGGSVEDCIERAWSKAGPPCLTAALTTSGGFCALWAAGFGGFQQLGTILAVGVLLCVGAMLLVLPLLIRWREKRPYKLPARRLDEALVKRPPTYRLAPVGLLISVVITLAAATQVHRIEFQYDMSELRPEGLAFGDLTPDQQRLATASYAPLIVSYDDDAKLTADHELISGRIAKGELPAFKGVLSIRSILPADQAERVAALQQIIALARPENVQYLPLPVQENLKKLAATAPRVLAATDLPRSLQHMLGALDGRHRMLILPAGNMWDLRNTEVLRVEAEGALPGRQVAGEYMAMATLYRLFQGDIPVVVAWALGIVFVLTLFDMRSLKKAIATTLALGGGMAWAVAAMIVFDMKLSVVNFVGLPILLGMGVDTVIHLLHRLDEEGPGRVRQALATTGWATGLSTATTVVSFAALALATHRGVQSLGLMIVLGLSLVTLAGFVFIPLGWMTAWKVTGKLPRMDPPPGA
jgi:predicted exporter